MLRRIKSIIFVICIVMVFTAQTYRLVPSPREAPKQKAPKQEAPRQEAPKQGAPKQEAPRQEAPRQEAPRRVVHMAAPIVQPHLQPVHQEREAPRVYAISTAVPVENNRLFHRQHHNNWQPRYNFYDNQYHFYPYVNIASIVELTGSYVLVVFNGQNYYYDQGTFYLLEGRQYVAVVPPIGIIVNSLPVHARQIIVNNQVFYRYKGIFYVQVAQGYQVIGPAQAVSDDS